MLSHTRRPVVRVVLFERRLDQGADRILLVNHVHPERDGHRDFWCFPGGGVEQGESFGEAAVREMAEETHLEIEPLGIGWIQDVVEPGWVELYVWAIHKSGELQLGYDPEREGRAPVLTHAEWVPLDQLADRLVLPEDLAARLADARGRLAEWPLLPLPEATRF